MSKRITMAFISSIALGLAACSSGGGYQSKLQRGLDAHIAAGTALMNRMPNDLGKVADNGRRVIALLESISATSPIDCSDDRWSELESYAVEAQQFANYYRNAAGGLYGYEMRRRSLEIAALSSQNSVNHYLALADLLLEKGCLEKADGTYRGVVSMFTGSAFSAYRERALIGIQDVRQLLATKNKLPAKR